MKKREFTSEQISEVICISVSSKDSLVKLIDKLYNNASIFLDRKRESAYLLRNELMKSNQIQGTSIKNPEPSLE